MQCVVLPCLTSHTKCSPASASLEKATCVNLYVLRISSSLIYRTIVVYLINSKHSNLNASIPLFGTIYFVG